MQKLTRHNQKEDLESEMMFRSAYLIHCGISIAILEQIYQKVSNSLSRSTESDDGKTLQCRGTGNGTNRPDVQVKDHIAMRWADEVLKGEITEDLYQAALGEFTREGLMELTLTVVLIERIVEADFHPNLRL